MEKTEEIQLSADAVIDSLLEQIKALSFENAKLRTQIVQMRAAAQLAAQSLAEGD